MKYDGVIAAAQRMLHASVHHGGAAVGYKESTYPRASSKTSGMTHCEESLGSKAESMADWQMVQYSDRPKRKYFSAQVRLVYANAAKPLASTGCWRTQFLALLFLIS